MWRKKNRVRSASGLGFAPCNPVHRCFFLPLQKNHELRAKRLAHLDELSIVAPCHHPPFLPSVSQDAQSLGAAG
jgi:hypothetical protein